MKWSKTKNNKKMKKAKLNSYNKNQKKLKLIIKTEKKNYKKKTKN